MTSAQLAFRRPPGPDEPVTLGIDRETLAILKLHLGLLLPRFRLHLLDEAEPHLELGINLRAAGDIFMRPEVR